MAFFKQMLGLLVLLVVFDRSWAEEKELSVSELLWKANKDVVHREDEPLVVDDIAYDNENERNADPCTSRGCMWGKSNDGKVYVPYVIAGHYSSRERSIIERGLLSFNDVTCIRFVKTHQPEDYLNIQSDNGDQYIKILWHNIQSGWEYAFDKINTLNQGTPYDYNSVMQYHRYAFSGNNRPTMEPIPNANSEHSVQMLNSDESNMTSNMLN
ncbi:High choriolytic enzyme 1 [Larimichthys crocea]|uniref:High choriolytic enzyme 1 n=1 Tax=Larimichthys crocea TaxID=215358 RepID=A0A6G0IZC0_LARCR|nr:High choriolytic enzyme 1 [Larimichthys crocea]